MTYVPIEVDFYANPKFLDVSNAATGLWLKCAAWCKGYLTDGVIPLKMVRKFGGTVKQISDLVESGLWEESIENGQKTYLFHDWFDYNLPRKEVEKRRQKERDLKRKSRSQKRANQWKSENVRRGHPTDVREKIALTLVQEEVQVKIKEEREGGTKPRGSVAAPVALCPVPDAPSPQIENGLTPAGVAPATAVGHSAALEPQGPTPVGAPQPVVVDPQSAVEPAPAPVLEDPWAGLPDLADHQTAQASDTDCADGRVPACLNPTSEKTVTAKDQAVVAAVRAYQVIGTPAEWSSPDDPRCRKHAYLPREEVPPCRNCMRSRQWFEQRAVAEKQAHLAAIHACPLCDERGFVEVKSAAGKTVVAHCDHTGELPKPKAETQPRPVGRGMPAHLREKLDGILGRQTAQETAPEAPQKPETRSAHNRYPNHDPSPAEERSGELLTVGAAS